MTSQKMKRLLLILLLVSQIALAVGAWGATYYIANAGDDAAAGTSTGAPWKTIYKVNSATFSGDDSISFNKGDTWYETLITPSSGTDGHQITVTSHGVGNKPIISGALDGSVWPVGTPSELIVNGGAEDALGAEWTLTLGTGGAITQDNGDKNSGTYSIKAIYGSAGSMRLGQVTLLGGVDVGNVTVNYTPYPDF